jgi:hypothetical protein
MANLIRLKQIESGSSLSTAANVGQNFTASVQAALPTGIYSSSAQLPTGILSSSIQVATALSGAVVNNLTISSNTDAYSLIVQGAVAVVDATINNNGFIEDVPGEIFINGRTGSAAQPTATPYDSSGNPTANIIDNGTW